jgi:hypothetical protein
MSQQVANYEWVSARGIQPALEPVAQIMETKIFQARVTDCASEGGFELADHAFSAPTGEKEFLCCGVGNLNLRYPSRLGSQRNSTRFSVFTLLDY